MPFMEGNSIIAQLLNTDRKLRKDFIIGKALTQWPQIRFNIQSVFGH